METGKTLTLKHVVQDSETAQKIGSGGLPVYATPAMAALMEECAYRLALSCGEETVGTRLEISHVRACLPDTELTARAEITETEGRRIVCKVEVSDSEGLIGEGSHERFVIDPERFMSRLGGR